jgi:uncharacterized membrane protein
MEPDGPDITPAGPKPSEAKPDAESAIFDAHCETQSVVVKAPVADVYGYWYRFEEFPTFITSLRDVQRIDETHFSFTSPLEEKTVLQIVLRVPERRIAWQAISHKFPRGVVLFEPLSDRATEVTVKLRSSIEPAMLVKVTREYLTNFKQIVERAFARRVGRP